MKSSLAVLTTEADLRRILREEFGTGVSGPRLMTKVEAARYLGLSVRSLDELVRNGDLARVELCGPKFDVRELDRLVEERRKT